MSGPLSRLLTKYSQVNWALCDQAMVSASNFATGIILARFLGLEEFGRFTLAWMLVLFFHTIQRAIILSPMMSIGPKQSESDAADYYAVVSMHQVLFCILVFVVTWGGIAFGATLFPEWRIGDLGLPVGCAAAGFQIQDFLRRYFFTRGRGKVAMLTDAVRYVGQIAVLLWLFQTVPMNSARTLWVIAGVSMLGAAVAVFQIERLRFTSQAVRETTLYHWRFSRWLLASDILQWSVANLLLMAAGALLGVAAVGALRAAQTIMGALHVLFLGLENVVRPTAARLFREAGAAELVSYLWRVTGWGGAVTAIVAVAAAVTPEFWLDLAYGSEYAAYGFLLRWYALSYVVMFLTVPLGTGLRTIEATGTIFWASLTATTVMIIVAYPLIAAFGLSGVVMGILISQILLQGGMATGFYRQIKRFGDVGVSDKSASSG